MNDLKKLSLKWILLVAILRPFTGKTQIDTITIEEVQVVASKVTKTTPGSFIQTIDKEELDRNPSGNLTGLLGGSAGLFFKTYGQGSLATSSLRGGGASHTTILWNGFNLQNPMNGVADFSLFPVILSDAVSVQHGGGSSLQGSGSLGGAVFLENQVRTASGYQATAGVTVGSFGDFRQFGKVTLGHNLAAGDVRFYHQQTENNFPIAGRNGQRQVHANLEQWAFSQNNTLKINEKQKLESFFWWQKTGRNIPPSLTENNAHARQEDGIARLGLTWSRLGNRSVTKARGGYFSENLLYFSDLIDSSESRAHTWIAEAEQAFFSKKNQIVRAGLNLTRQQADTRETGPQRRIRTAIFASWHRQFLDQLTCSLDAREEWVDDGFIPPVLSVGAEWQMHPAWRLSGRFSKNYNLPTFNDLYWQDAFAQGNPGLQPETSWGEDLGLHFGKSFQKWKISSQVIFYNNLVKNWILWAPKGNRWQPDNKRTVWARGLEHFVEFGHLPLDSTAWWASIRLNWSLTRSTVQEIYEQDDPALTGRQLIYTPVLNGGLSLTFHIRQWHLGFQQVLTGKRYTTTDNSEANALSAFQISELSLGKNWPLIAGMLRTQATIGNLFNADYQAIAARPMPGRHFRIDVHYEFSGKNSR